VKFDSPRQEVQRAFHWPSFHVVRLEDLNPDTPVPKADTLSILPPSLTRGTQLGSNLLHFLPQNPPRIAHFVLPRPAIPSRSQLRRLPALRVIARLICRSHRSSEMFGTEMARESKVWLTKAEVMVRIGCARSTLDSG